jgi:AbrB family looped-hinge helix DNA binding protein
MQLVPDAAWYYSYWYYTIPRGQMRITSKGQVTIPQEIRERIGLLPDTEVEFEVVGNAVKIRKAPMSQARGRTLVARLKGRADRTMTTDDIMKLTRG